MNQDNFSWVTIDDVMVGYGTNGKVKEEVWDRYVYELQQQRITRYLGLIAGTLEVTSLQRKASAEVAKAKRISVAIVTDDRLVRGLVTAVSWLGNDIRAFSWVDLAAAYQYLRLSPMHQAQVAQAIERMRQRFAIPLAAAR